MGDTGWKPLIRASLPPLLALQSFLSILGLLDLLQVEYLALLHRAIRNGVFGLGFSLTPILLLLSASNLIYLVSSGRYRKVVVTAIVSAFLYLFYGMKISTLITSILLLILSLFSLRRVRDFLFWFLAMLTGFESIALIHWVLLPLVAVSPLAGAAELELKLFFINAAAAPLITLAALFTWLIKPTSRPLNKIKKFLPRHLNMGADPTPGEVSLNVKPLLILSVSLSMAAALYPYIPSVNTDSLIFGVDVRNYVRTMGRIERGQESIFFASRPTLWLILFFLKGLLGAEPIQVITYLPLLLNPLLVLSTYFMVSQASGDRVWAGVSAFFTAVGFNVTVGMYSYLLADHLCLIFLSAALGLLFRDLGKEGTVVPIPALVLGGLAVFTHPWSLFQFYAPLVLFSLILGYRHLRGDHRGGFYTALIFILGLGIVDVLKATFLGGLGGVEAAASTAPSVVRLDNFWRNNFFTFRYLYGGLLSNSVFLTLSGVGLFFLNLDSPFQLFLELLLSLSSLYYIVGHFTLSEGVPYNYIPARIIYNLPFGVFAALAMMYLIRSKRLDRKLRLVSFVFVTTYMMVYLFRSLANLVN